jgi:hypothetical protein
MYLRHQLQGAQRMTPSSKPGSISGSRTAKLIASGLLMFSFFRFESQGQSDLPARKTGSESPEAVFLAGAEAEGKRGAYVFYRQSFVDTDSNRATYRGSIYGAMQSVKLSECLLEAEILIVDLFSGTVGKTQIGQLQDMYKYSVRIPLTSDIANRLVLTRARPIQLSGSTHTVCDQDSSCTFEWVRILAKNPAIKERRTINGLIDFDGYVDHILVPVSSSDAGNQLIGQLRAVVDSRCSEEPH